MRLELGQVTRAGEAAAGSEKQYQCTTYDSSPVESCAILTEQYGKLCPYSNKGDERKNCNYGVAPEDREGARTVMPRRLVDTLSF